MKKSSLRKRRTLSPKQISKLKSKISYKKFRKTRNLKIKI
jgi:hypothetical protein